MPKCEDEDSLQKQDVCIGNTGPAGILKESDTGVIIDPTITNSQDDPICSSTFQDEEQPSCSYIIPTVHFENESCNLPPTSGRQLHKMSMSIENWPISITEMKLRIGQQPGKFSKKSRKYYKCQQRLLKAYESFQLYGDLESGSNEKEQKLNEMANKLAKGTLVVNLFLLMGSCAAAYLSSSLSLMYSVIDNGIDVIISLAIWYTNRVMSKKKVHLYPHGRKGLEPVTLIIVTVMMVMASLMVIEKAIESLIHKTTDVHMGIPTICLISIGIAVKLILFLICRRYDNPSIKILVKEQRNEMMVNTVALACGFIGDKVWPLADPIGAIVINLYVLGTWLASLKKNIYFLEGRAARPHFLNQITWVCLHHDSRIVQINSIHACYFGTLFLVEVDIVLPRETGLREAHDVGEALQKKLEKLNNVGFAFVHVDYTDSELPPPRRGRVKDKPF